MYLATDYVHTTSGRGRCRARVFLPSDPERDVPVVVCSELPGNTGQSVTNAAERIAGSVVSNFALPVPPVWIGHYPPETTDGQAETFVRPGLSSSAITRSASSCVRWKRGR